MSADTISLTVSIISIIASIMAAYYGVTIYKYNRLNKGWLGVPAATTIAILARALPSLRDFGFVSLSAQDFQLLNYSVLITTSILAAWGLWSMKKSFESFDIVEKKVREKAEAFNKLRR